jgi:hypothetical protein
MKLWPFTMPAMRIIDPQSGRAHLEKRRQRYNIARQPRELTFSYYRRYPFLGRPRVREWFREALEAARACHPAGLDPMITRSAASAQVVALGVLRRLVHGNP